ncbi:LacI family DNA-binding transcriptional regulator [Nocardioides zeae]|uniref:LacI family DNA-binding transcriptional regulator n=1 Tax=Nocardioides imazamoxiresistens TaxID=3231893 RepID=A0ABU3Q087_9ACTN|nr:LacI family DNA-binding transcriptional regulator [Nocardioides zeae]MDT9594784.1 LacI family DNA-binding transcriptional regulator [Nocardioides zeae]
MREAEQPHGAAEPTTASVPPTLADVAALAGVSRQTVSNALNNPALLRADTLERVRSAIAELGYSPNRAARNLRTRASRLIGLRLTAVVDETANPTTDRFVHSLVQASREAGYHVLLFDGDDPDDPASGYDALVRSTAVDAFVVTDTFRGNPQAAHLEASGVPFVAFGRPWKPAALHPWVDVDGGAGVAAATRHLVERRHTRIAWVGWRAQSHLGEDRRDGWARTLRERGLPVEGLAARGDDTPASGYAAASALLDSAAPTAFVCASDTLAAGVLDLLRDRGLGAGRDVAVVGFDDSPFAQLLPGGLTSVRQPLEDVAVHLVAQLGELLARRAPYGTGTLLEPRLVVRGSTLTR